MMTKLREALRNMKNFDIPCGPISTSMPDEVVSIEWTSDHKNFNVGLVSHRYFLDFDFISTKYYLYLPWSRVNCDMNLLEYCSVSG